MKKNASRIIGILLCLHTGMPCATAQTVDTLFTEKPDTAACPFLASDSLEMIKKTVETEKPKKTKPCIYALPYSRRTSCPDYKRMWLNTSVLFAGGLAALGVLELLPEGATAWNKEDLRRIPFFKRWSYHVRKGPVWDHDNFIFNYVLHPYAGAAYYMSARSLGFNVFGSFLYCTGISTIFWEYGIEAFMEIPSIQDLFITPLSGLFLGEAFYRLKRHIVDHNYTLWNSKLLGNIVAFFIDPVNEVIGLFAGNPCREMVKNRLSLSCTPWLNSRNGVTFGFTLNVSNLF